MACTQSKILSNSGFEIVHIGYDQKFVEQDINRLVPLDVVKAFVENKHIGKLHDVLYSTSGGVCVLKNVRIMGQQIALQLKSRKVSGVILTST